MKELLDGLRNWVVARDLSTLDPLRGRLSQKGIADSTAFARANYIRILQDYQVDRSGSHSKLLSG
jgi:dihydroorotate dehydrogenase (fumarate)